MANFFDPKTRAGITTVTAVKGAKVKVGLFGGGPGPDFQRLKLSTETAPSATSLAQSDPAVSLAQDLGSWNFIYEIDTSRMRSDTLHACLDNGVDYAAPVVFSFTSANKAEVRKSIVDLARTFVADAHYLWGTAGNTTDQQNGNFGGGKKGAATLRDYSLDAATTDRDKIIAVCTAVQPNFDGYNTCAGRPSRFSQEQNLDDYIKARQADIAAGKTDQTQWSGAAGNLHPRKYFRRSSLEGGGKIVWGESCVGHRHFDCVGLVNYCYAQHWYQAAFGMDIVAFRNPSNGAVQITNADDRMDGDILIPPGNGHIAMLYQAGASWKIVQAEQTTVGLTDSANFDPARWDRFRMNSAYLVPRKALGF